MGGKKKRLNTIYISDRLKECFGSVSQSAMTSVVAPMGYGKTTAVNWYLEECEKREEVSVVRISVYSDNLMIFWKSVTEAFSYSGFDFLKDYPCPEDAAGSSMLTDDICRELKGSKPCYIFIDDFHLLSDGRIREFLFTLAYRLPNNVHLIVASRDRFLPDAQIVRMGRRLSHIGLDQLRLNHAELALYVHKCGVLLTDAQLDGLMYSSEGWFSAIYLNLRTFSEEGRLPDYSSDIYAMFTAAIMDPLSQKQKEFLAVMGLADEFTVPMARYVTGSTIPESLLIEMTEQNAFVKRLPDGVHFRFHHMMKECAERVFNELEEEKQYKYCNRFGSWYESGGQYIHAMSSYLRNSNYDGLLQVIKKDAGILLSGLEPSEVLEALERCPRPVLKRYPLSILVLMRCMFNWRMIPKMLELKTLFMASIEEHPDMSETERGNLLGECDLIMSFLMYNDISAMSRLHRSASDQMSRPAISIRNNGGWTFGSPSVLMMFHRQASSLDEELREMDECMPYYYRITEGHGRGAEKIMRAEALYMRAGFVDAMIMLENAYEQIRNNGQENMALCCDFLALRLSFCKEGEFRYNAEERYRGLLKHHNSALINIYNASTAYYYALCGDIKRIPEVFSGHMLSKVNILAPGKPMIEMIENQVYLAQGAYAKVIGRCEGLLAMCEAMKYGLVALHVRIQTAAAYERLGKHKEAAEQLELAVEAAIPDELVMPFVENYGYINKQIEELARRGGCFVQKIIQLGREIRGRMPAEGGIRPAVFDGLTDREFEMVKLLAERLSNREIAEKLYLSVGSVKQYVTQIYSKLQIDGEPRKKRKKLAELLDNNK